MTYEQVTSSKSVFISYAREDVASAERLYSDLKNAGLQPWRDKDAIRAGQNWKIAIRKAIKNSRYFLPLFSSKSVEKIGYVQREFKYAIDNYDKFPESKIYIIPVRLDKCEIPYEKLEDIEYVDLFPNWDGGIQRIFDAMDVEVLPEKRNHEKTQEWQMGMSEENWTELLFLICKKKCIPFIGAEIYAARSKNGETVIPFCKDIVEKWKERYRYPLDDLYELARVYTLEDSYQLARLAQFLEIEKGDERYPKAMLSDMIKQITPYNYSPGRKSPFEILADLDLPIYLTTNYDRFMEESLSRNPRKKPESDFCKWNDKLIKYAKAANIPSVFDNTQYTPNEDKPVVYHIQGEITIPGSMVLTERDYFEFVINLNKGLDQDIIPSVIRTELATSSFLFVGYSLENINFRLIFQGFLSFLSSVSSEFRKPSIAVQIPPRISHEEQVNMQRYLEQYTRNMFDVRVYWGNTSDFLLDLERRWEDFGKNNDTRTCLPLGSM